MTTWPSSRATATQPRQFKSQDPEYYRPPPLPPSPLRVYSTLSGAMDDFKSGDCCQPQLGFNAHVGLALPPSGMWYAGS